jgi:hypothetical protein
LQNCNPNGEGTEPTLPEVDKERADDALGLALSEAPQGSLRERYRYAKEHIFSLIEGLEDEGERGPALDDVAKELKLGKKDLRNAFAEFEAKNRQEREDTEHDEGRAEEDLIPEPGSERHKRAMELLRCPDLLRKAAEDMERLGHVGEPGNKQLALVCAVSAKAGAPIQPSTHAQSSAGKNFLWDSVVSLLPPEMVIKRSGLSAKALFRTEVDLRGAVLYLQEVAGSEGAEFAIRVMQSDGRLVYEATEKAPDGSLRNVVYEKEGPVVIVQTTTKLHIHHENETRVLPIYIDESAEQTKRIVRNTLMRAKGEGDDPEEREYLLGVWHDAVRLLGPGEVIVPYADRIELPTSTVRVRRDVGKILDVVRIVAWLRQHHRERDKKGRIVATEDDFCKALELIGESLGRAWKALTPVEEATMKAVSSLREARQQNGFRRTDLEVEAYDKRRVQEALKSLVESGYLESARKDGPGGYVYTLSRDPEDKGLGIYLRAPGGEGQDDAKETDADEHGDPGASNALEEEEEDESYDEAEDALTGRELYDPREENPLEELTELGWFRSGTDFIAEESPEEDVLDGDPVVYRLRHAIPVYGGMSPENCVDAFDDTPLAVTAEDVFNWEAQNKTEEELRSAGWPTTPEEMDVHLKRIIPLLQRVAHRFYDPGRDEWYCNAPDVRCPDDPEKLCNEAYLHAELWVNEEISEEVWALTALRQNWQPPDKAIEGIVWLRVTRDDDEVVELEIPPPKPFTF